MRFLGAQSGAYDWDGYLRYLDEVKERMPSSAMAYALMQARTHDNHARALHDSWVTRVDITCEVGVDDAGLAQVRFELLAPGHDGFHEITHQAVSAIECQAGQGRRVVTGGLHGDWLFDEVMLTPTGKVHHEVRLSSGHWVIECADVRYTWRERQEPSPDAASAR